MSKLLQWISSKKILIGFLPSFILIFLSSFLITFAMFYLAPESFSSYWSLVIEQPFLFLLNYLPVLLFIALLFFLFQNTVLAISISASFFLILSMINRAKFQLRQSPLLPTDITLFSEIITLLNKFNFSFVFSILGILIFVIIFVTFSILFFKNKKLPLAIRFSGILLCIFLGFILNVTLYSNSDLYDSFRVIGNTYFQINHYQSKGFLYSFVHNFNKMKVKKPAGYSKIEFENLPSSDVSKFQNQPKPHIIMVMGEAFTDLSLNENLDFEGYTDPLTFYKELIEQPDVISGHIVVPNFGGGTADTEFDVLTGCPTIFIDNSLSSYSFIKNKFEGITQTLREIGYDTAAIHPGNYWFYNRANVYDYMGFQDFYFLEKDFHLETQSIAGYISDEAVTEFIIETFHNHQKKSTNPLFEFIVTIQNHGPFTDKYNQQKNFNTSLSITQEQENLLSNYFYGVADADRQIQELITYFSEEKEPVILVYFGDHLPGFPNSTEFFQAFQYDIDINGTAEQRLNFYKTPFFIWENESAKKITSFTTQKAKLALPEDTSFSAAFLGEMVLELAGFQNASPYFQFISEMRKELPVVSWQGYMNADSQYLETINDEQKEKIHKWFRWVYYKMFDQKNE